MSGLTKFNIPEIAARLDQPFLMADVAYVDDILVSVYICEGEIERHKHVDIDELFWVYEGAMHVDSECGDVRLESGELTVVPKGTRHRSRSADRATVILLRCGFLPNRKNGKRRLYAADDGGLPCLNIRGEADGLQAPYRFRTIARIEDSIVQIARGSGRWPVELPVAHDRMLYVADGELIVRTVRHRLRLMPGDFTIIPRGAFYHLHTADDTVLLQVTRRAS
ncbi:MAG: cupin domain-containing protein [Anaerolineae bacterium]